MWSVATGRGNSRVEHWGGDATQLEVDEFVSLIAVEGSFAVGSWYEAFEQTSDEQVLKCLERGAARW